MKNKISHIKIVLILIITGLLSATVITHAAVIDVDFNSGIDSLGNSQGDLIFNGTDGFQLTFTDDESSGIHGNANGVHITNLNFGNIKVGSSDLVLGAFNSFSGSNNFHSSGIVANFSQGVDLVSFNDADDDSTLKTLFAFDQSGTLIGQTSASSQILFSINTSSTGGGLIWSVEFDTQAGTAGGSFDTTVFTIDNFHVEFTPVTVPEPGTYGLIFSFIMALVVVKYRRK